MTDLDLTAPDPAPPPGQDADHTRPHPAHLPLPSPQAPSPPPPGATVAARLLADLHTEIGRADSKAAVLVAALGMTAGVFTGLLAGKDWSPGSLGAAGPVLWWAGTAALAVSLLALLLAVLPATAPTPGPRASPSPTSPTSARQRRRARPSWPGHWPPPNATRCTDWPAP